MTHDIERFQEPLSYIKPDDRETWLKVGAALHHEGAGGERAYQMWCQWSRQSEKYDEEVQRRTWKSFKQGKGVTGGTLIQLAKDNGWQAGQQAPAGPRPKPNGRVNWTAHQGELKPRSRWNTVAEALAREGYREVAAYPYVDAGGNVVAEKIRFERTDTDGGKSKTFRWMRQQDGVLVSAGPKGACPPYCLPRLLEHADQTVFIVEGEKDADTANEHGLVAISIERGHEDAAAAHLLRRTVFIVPDNDSAGRDRAEVVLKAVRASTASARLLTLPGLAEKGDLTDWLNAGHTVSDLVKATEEATQADNNRLLSGFTMYHDIEMPSEEEWLVDDILPAQGIGLCYGPSGAGKTFGVLDMALAIARGVPFAGSIEVQQGTAVFIALEAPAGVRKRIKAYQQEKKCNTADFALLKYNLNICDHQSVTGLVEQLAAFQKHHAKPIKLLVFDTLAKAMPGHNENESGTAGTVLKHMQLIQEAIGGCVLGVHHPGKQAGQGMRGSSAFEGGVDFTLEIVRRNKNSPIREFWCRKQKEIEDQKLVGVYRLSQRVLGVDRKGKEITSAIVEWIENGQASVSLAPQQREIMDALDEVVISKLIAPSKGHPDIPDGAQAVDGKDLFTEYHNKTKTSPDEVATSKKKDGFRSQLSKLCNEKGVLGRSSGMYWKRR